MALASALIRVTYGLLALSLLMSCRSVGSDATPFLAADGDSRRPNIIFILADDLGWQDVGFNGSSWFETPNLDQLAEDSVVFTDAYMYPLCSPSRAALASGQHSFRTGIYGVPVLEKGTAEDNVFSRWSLPLTSPHYAEILSNNGYALSHIGKWHLVGPDPSSEENYPLSAPLRQPPNGDFEWLESHMNDAAILAYYPEGRGFDENVGGTFWGDPARGYPEGYQSESGGYKAPFRNPFIDDESTDGWLTDRLTDEAISFISRQEGEPFFVNLHFYAPHRPTVVRDAESYAYFKNKTADELTGQGAGDRDEIAAYATMVRSIDENVGRLVDYLDQEGLRNNTLIIFTSDNGFNSLQSVNNQLRGAKGSIYEGGVRVPAFVNWPGRIEAEENSTPISALDYFPTFLQLAVIDDFEGGLDGDSLVPLLLNEGSFPTDRPIFWHIASTYRDQPNSAVRKGDWKLIEFLLDGRIELYNLENDLGETTNLATEDREVAEELTQLLHDWRRENDVPLPPSSVVKH